MGTGTGTLECRFWSLPRLQLPVVSRRWTDKRRRCYRPPRMCRLLELNVLNVDTSCSFSVCCTVKLYIMFLIKIQLTLCYVRVLYFMRRSRLSAFFYPHAAEFIVCCGSLQSAIMNVDDRFR